MRKLFTFLISVLIVASLVQCEKGDIGPTGPQGEKGLQGEKGIDGTNGEKGDKGDIGDMGPLGPIGATGTANVIYSDFAQSNTGIRDTVVDGSNIKVTHLIVPEITEEVIQSGTILVYMKFNSQVHSLPYTSSAGGKANTISSLLNPGRIYITRFTHDNSASAYLTPLLSYRYIIIPGGMKAQLNGVDIGDYQRVKAALGLN